MGLPARKTIAAVLAAARADAVATDGVATDGVATDGVATDGTPLERGEPGPAMLDTELLLAHVLKVDRSHVIAHGERLLTEDEHAGFLALVRRRLAGEPLAYLTGHREFWSIDLEIGPDVLIPRPETETLVEAALDVAGPRPVTVADLGTGSGAIALALATERPDWQIVASDVDPKALAVAARNHARLHGGSEMAPVRFVLADWCACFGEQTFDLVVCNPPYIDPADSHLAALRYEPPHALVAGEGGFAHLTRIVDAAIRVLRPGGHLLLEHGMDQGPEVCSRLTKSGYRIRDRHQDLAGHGRVVSAQLP